MGLSLYLTRCTERKRNHKCMAVFTVFYIAIPLKLPVLVRHGVLLTVYFICGKHADFLVYDDGCHLRKFSTNSKRCGLTETAMKIANTKIVVDKMHFRGHKDHWCRRHCNPYDYEELSAVRF